MLQERVPGVLWTADMDVAPGGFSLGARSTIVRLPEGLWVHSPIALTPDLRSALDALGPVTDIVSPARFHVGHVREFARAYPQARLYATAAGSKSLRDLPLQILDETVPAPWNGVLLQAPFRGSSLYEEVDFYHPESRTLILTDLCFNIPGSATGMTRWTARVMGILGKVSVSRSFRLTMRNRRQARDSVLRLLDWDFDRLLLTHGSTLESGGREAFERAFSWLLHKDGPR